MLSSLPIELIREIIESTVPHSFHSATYKARQHTLCSLSLVSKLFRSIAQPLLLEIVWIESTSEIDRLPVTGASRIGEQGQRVQCAVVELSRWGEVRQWSVKVASLERALRLFQAVTRLTVVGDRTGESDLSIFESLPHLSHLHLSGYMWTCSRPLILPTIRSLALGELEYETMEVLLSRTTLPNLKEFALVDAALRLLEALEKRGFRALLPQLEALSLAIAIWRDPRAAFLHPAANRTLVNCGTVELRRLSAPGPPIVSLRIQHDLEEVIGSETHLYCKNLDDYANFISSNPTLPLRHVYMDAAHELHSNLPNLLVKSLTKFRRACQERQIDLIFDPVPANSDIDPCFPSDFLRRRRTAEKD